METWRTRNLPGGVMSTLHELDRTAWTRSAGAIFRALMRGMVVWGALTLLQAQSPAPPAKSDSGNRELAADTRRVSGAHRDDYLISTEDVLAVNVYDMPDMSCECTVSPAGTITLPLLPKPVGAEGLTPEQLAAVVEKDFNAAGLLSNPQVTVLVKQSRRHSVTIDGGVKSPQVYPLMGRIGLLDLISQAGGLSDDAGDTVTVNRGPLALRELDAEGKPSPHQVTVDVSKASSSNVEVFPGDRVTVENAGMFYVLGEVNRPGGYNLKTAHEQVTVLEALAIAGDLTSTAKGKKALIIRRDPKAPGRRTEVPLDLREVLTARVPDKQLQANDILYVPSSRGKRAVRALGVATQTFVAPAGLLVYRR
jgi:polysaccharide export outer membrane protein